MIDKASLSCQWLEEKKSQYKKDPSIIEGMIYALYLLNQLKLTGLDFIFKGGTSLVLVMYKPLRFSVDIDIIIDPSITRNVVEEHLSKISASSEFIRMELDERRSYKEGIPKAHYKFIYCSNVSTRNKEGEVVSNPEREILLDVLFSINPYPVLIQREIKTDWVATSGEPLTVLTPDINSIAGDKLVAFAPCTTGVSYGVEKEKEIVKQLFDVGTLFHLIGYMEVFRTSYHNSAECEIKYRPERNIASVQAILLNTIDTAKLIARREFHHADDEDSKMKYAEISRGINQFGHFVFEGNFRIDHAQVASAKAAYLAALLLTGSKDKPEIFDASVAAKEDLVAHPDYNFLNKRLKFVAEGEALFYWRRIIKLLHPEQT
ncbi:MAG: nucleotidyl transferase AbiEii/AbiGii toxin family protein [Chitinophagaceae bacterium]